MDKKIITSGIASEYVLSGLSDYLRQQGYEVIEIDFKHFSGDARELLNQLKKEETIYITSAHTNLTLRTASVLAPSFVSLYPNYLAPVEIIPILRPCASIYIPHDLLTPYGDSNLHETRFMGIFDHVLAPLNDSTLILPHTTQVHHAGWIRYVHKLEKSPKQLKNNDIRILLFISMIEHMRLSLGIEKLVDYFNPLFNANIKIKFPDWKGIEEIEKAFRQVGWDVIPASTNSMDLILDADVVVCNGASSIHAESALMGLPTICLLDEEGISSAMQLEKLQDLPNIYFHDYRQRAPISMTMFHDLVQLRSEAIIQPFDYELLKKIIE